MKTIDTLRINDYFMDAETDSPQSGRLLMKGNAWIRKN